MPGSALRCKGLLVCRHAETDYNRDGRVNGDPLVDVALSEVGLEQAERLRARLSTVELDVVVTTEFRRAVETARRALRGRNVPMLSFPELNDPRLGSLEGADLETYRRWRKDHALRDRIPGGGESQLDAILRYERGWRKVLEVPGRVLVIAHAFPISFLLTVSEEGPPHVRGEYERSVAPATLHGIDLARVSEGLRAVAAELDALGVEGSDAVG